MTGVERKFEGVAVSPGIIFGKVFLYGTREEVVTPRKISVNEIENERIRLDDALMATRHEIQKIKQQISKNIGASHAEIFTAHIMILSDPVFIDAVIEIIREELYCAEYALYKVVQRYIESFQKIKDEYLQERAADIKDVMKRILNQLTGERKEDALQFEKDVVVISYDLSPSDTALMHKSRIVGFATDMGGRTSHTAIMARALEIPAVVALGDLSPFVQGGDEIIVNGNDGIVIVHPTKATIAKYISLKKVLEKIEHSLEYLKNLPSITKDGRKIILSSNIELPEEVNTSKEHGAEGIGLYRTEFFYMNKKELPTEEEHFQAYLSVAKKIFPHSVIIRTFDLGGDKIASLVESSQPEMNSFLGWRAIRFSLENVDIFKTQLRAILRASYLKNVKLMYPMVSTLEELRRANQILQKVKKELKREGKKFDENMQVGMMIEVPSAAMISHIFAKEVDFFSIGTNDLIQYSLAVDRGNEKVAHLYQPAHPGILRVIKMIVDAGHQENIWVGMCGEMAGDPDYTLLLIGLGLDELSVSPIVLPQIKKIIRSVEYHRLKSFSEKMLELSTSKEILRKAKRMIQQYVPELINLPERT